MIGGIIAGPSTPTHGTQTHSSQVGVLVEDLLWALGVEGQRDVAQLTDVTGCGLSRDGLPFAAVLVGLQAQGLLPRLDLLSGGGPENRAVLVQLVLQPLNKLILLVQLQLQLVDQGVALPQLLDLLLQGVLEVPQGPHQSTAPLKVPVWAQKPLG